MNERTLTIALDRYERHVPFFMGLVDAPPGFRLRALEVGMVPPRRDGLDRHGRMLRDREFDVAETSLASYIIAKAGGAPITAVPTFPRRLFSQNHIWVNVDSGIDEPGDLIGRRVAFWAFQVTMSVLAKGDLQSEYGVPWREIRWIAQYPEEIPEAVHEVCIERMPPGCTGSQMLIDGEVDAFIHPHPPRAIFERTDRVRRLFNDARGESLRYFGKHGYYPIMHVLAMRADLADEHPQLPRALMGMWDDAYHQAQEFYLDPNYTMMPFGRWCYEEQRELFGHDAWPSGLSANRPNLERFIGYLHDQRLLPEPVAVESLFHPSTIDT